jgi:hypothetical protein
MPSHDEPLPEPSADEIEEISSDFIIQDEPVAPVAPAVHDDPFVAASRALAAAPPVAAPARAATAPSGAPAPKREPVSRPAEQPRRTPTPVASPAPEPAPRRQAFPLVVALVFLLVGAAGGFFAGVLWERQGALPPKVAPAAAAPTPAPEPTAAPEEPAAPKPAKGAKPARKAPAPAAARSAAPRGKLKLTAPAEAVVYLDGRKIGRGSMNVDVPVGAHRIEVRLGKAKVAERFEVEANETWTYDVTPAK